MPSSELEALVGHLFIVGGRAISSASPGAVALPAPRKVARGRETDTLFALISLAEGQRQPAPFYEQLTSALSTRYFATPGSLTSALREAVNTINDTVHSLDAREAEPIKVGLACAVMREQEVILAMIGPARAFLLHQSAVERLPADEEITDEVRPLGVDSEPDLRLYRREIGTGDMLLLADTALNRLNNAALAQAAQSGEVAATLGNLRSVAGANASAIVIKFVAPLAEGAPAAQPQLHPAAAPGHAQAGPAQPLAPAQLAPARRIGRAAALGLMRMVEGARTLVAKMLPDADLENPLEERLQLSTLMQVGVAAAVAVIVAVLTLVIYQARGQTSQYAQLVRQASQEIQSARGGGDNQALARPHWELALFLLKQAAQLRPPASDVEAMQAEALGALDAYDHVTRVSPVPLRRYESGSSLKGPVLQGLNLYVIDTTKDILYREDLDQTSTSLVNAAPQIITRQGDQVNGQVVGGLVDLTWMEEGGAPQRNVLAVLARNGMLITYSPSSAISAVILPGFEAWRDPRAIAVYKRDLYVLDAGANEIWRYPAGIDSYSSLPQRTFTDQPPQLADALDMEIDTNGNIYVLHSNGKITKYFFGREQPFGFEGMPQPLASPSAMTLSLGLLDRSFFISDPGGGRLYAVALNGTFLVNYKDTQDSIFYGLSGIAVQDTPPMIYLTAGNGLYYFTRPQ